MCEGALRRPDPRIGVYLFYGPDTGLVSERAETVAERSVDDPNDPFQMIRLDGDVVASDPTRLADEAGTMGLFGGRRALWIGATSRNLAPALEPVLKERLQDTTIIIEGGDLAKSAPLRTFASGRPGSRPALLRGFRPRSRKIGRRHSKERGISPSAAMPGLPSWQAWAATVWRPGASLRSSPLRSREG